MKLAYRKTCRLKVMLYQPRNIGVVFQYKYGLAQTVCPRRAAVSLHLAQAARNYEQSNAARRIECKRCVNLRRIAAKQPASVPAHSFP
jgi:hypothetical protein